jgi:myosin heavy subunit
MAFDIEYAGLKSTYRRRVQDALKDIREGSIEERELDKLHNFCMVALMLMTKVNQATWRSAERMAELADLLQTGIELNESVQNEQHQTQNQNYGSYPHEPDDSEPSNKALLAHSESVEQVTDLNSTTDGRKSVERPVCNFILTSEDEARRVGQEVIRRDHLPSS